MAGKDIMTHAAFWQAVGGAQHCFLGLDYDGTLAPFRVERLQAKPLPGVAEILGAIRRRGTTDLAIVSGRAAAEVVALLGDLGVVVAGSHGYEIRAADGTVTTVPLDELQAQRLSSAEEWVRRLGLEDRLERKWASVAFHTRGLGATQAAGLERKVQERWTDLLEGTVLECRAFDGGVELLATGVDKGTTLTRLLSAQPIGTIAAYLGDDRTDEDAFAVMRSGGGYGVRVGEVERPSLAEYGLPSCAAVLEFLHKWYETRGG